MIKDILLTDREKTLLEEIEKIFDGDNEALKRNPEVVSLLKRVVRATSELERVKQECKRLQTEYEYNKFVSDRLRQLIDLGDMPDDFSQDYVDNNYYNIITDQFLAVEIDDDSFFNILPSSAIES